MKRATGGTWIVGLLVLGPFALVQLIELVRIIAMPSCGARSDAWCSDELATSHLTGWNHAGKAMHLLQASAMLILFCGAAFVVLRAAHRRRPLSRGARYGVIAAFAVWTILLLS